MRLFLDTNVYLDVILKRGAGFKEAEEILLLAQLGNYSITTSASCLITVIYFLTKAGLPKDVISQIMIELLKVNSLIETDTRVFAIAMKSNFTDLEDSVLYYTALEVGKINYFITTNTKDFKTAVSALPVLTPNQFITLYNESKPR